MNNHACINAPGKHRIFYRVMAESKRVEILSVWHSARREPELPA